MRKKKWFKRGPGAWAAWLAVAFCYGLFHVVPVRWIPSMGRRLGRVMHRLMGPRRQIALENLRLAMGGEMDGQARREILRSLMEGLGLTLGELSHPRYLRRETLRRFVAVQGLEHLHRALAGGKGAILVTTHFGNFPLMLARLGLEGYHIGVIIRDPRHRPAARFLDQWRERHGVVTLRDKPRWASVKDALTLLQSNGILVMHIDLNVSDRGAYVPFFGHWVPTFRGPAMLSLRTGAPAFPTFMRRLHGIHHRLIIRPPPSWEPTGQREEDVWRLLWLLTREAEDFIRAHPGQWWWIHRRFRKARPAEDVGRTLPVNV